MKKKKIDKLKETKNKKKKKKKNAKCLYRNKVPVLKYPH